jgi:putative selenium metabolism hydrolase
MAEAVEADLVAFTQRLIQTPSLPGEERQVAQLVKSEMERLGYDEARIDGAGNVIGLVRGRDAEAPKIMLNTHLDHVDPGDLALWPHPPYSGALVDGKIYGRGAVDIKGPMATHVYTAGALLRAGMRPTGDLYVVGVVMEEIGGTGMRYLLEHEKLPIDCCLIGEPSANKIMLGHRGRIALEVRFHGKAGHASAPERAQNPHYAAARFLLNLQESVASLPSHEVLGPSSIAPTLYHTDTTSANVIPSEVNLTLDWRTTSETEDFAMEFLKELLANVGLPAEAGVRTVTHRTYTGYEEHDWKDMYESFVTPRDNPFVQRLAAAYRTTAGRDPEYGIWRFATDGRLTHRAGIATVGFGPGDEALAHTSTEHVRVDDLCDALQTMLAFVG